MEENKLAIQNELSHVDIRNLIYTIRGKQVMLDSDVAMLYQYETKNVNKAVKRNINRFPEDFCFQLTKAEMDKMWFQNGTTSKFLFRILINNIFYSTFKLLFPIVFFLFLTSICHFKIP